MELKNRISNLRSQCEECFYSLSEMFDKEQAEKAAVIMLRGQINAQIKVHENYIKTCNTMIEQQRKLERNDLFSKQFNVGYVKGVLTANEARLNSHQKDIEELRQDLEILDLNLL